MMQEKIEKLPKWAQQHIKDLERQRDISRRELDEILDNQKVSDIYVDEYLCDETPPRNIKRFIQSHNVIVEGGGVRVDVFSEDDGVKFFFAMSNRAFGEDVAIFPQAANVIKLKNTGKKWSPSQKN